MINFLNKNWILLLIITLAIFLRFYKLNTMPALNADEAAIGYNAYSLLQTGKDEHGHPWPTTFQSFNDYKPGLYFYIVLPFVKFMGLNVWAVRIPGATFGVLTVLTIYFLTIELFSKKTLGLISALFLTISPWHLHFSRGGWEVNTATFFIALGLLMFFKFLRKPSYLYALCFVVPFVASLYTYHSARVVVPLLCLGLTIIYGSNLFKKKNHPTIVFGTVFGLVLLIPLFYDLLSPGALSRVAGVGLFADPGPVSRINEQRGEYPVRLKLIGLFLHNKVVNYGLDFVANWSSHFSGEFLFMTGDAVQRNKVPETGELYLFDIVFIAVGLIFFSKNFRENSSSFSLILFWLIISPIASALTFQSPGALRAHNMVIPLMIISSFGCYEVFNWIGRFHTVFLKYLMLFALPIFVLWNFARYEHMYWIHVAKEFPYSSQYGVYELVNYVEANQDKYKDIVVTTRYDQPYILFLFYMKYSPSTFQSDHTLTSRDQFGFSTVPGFSKYHFLPIDFEKLRKDYPNSLIIGAPTEIPKEANIVKKIYGSNNFEYFDIVAN